MVGCLGSSLVDSLRPTMVDCFSSSFVDSLSPAMVTAIAHLLLIALAQL